MRQIVAPRYQEHGGVSGGSRLPEWVDLCASTHGGREMLYLTIGIVDHGEQPPPRLTRQQPSDLMPPFFMDMDAPQPFRRTIMSKIQQSNKEIKKQPAMTSKEKKQAKRDKKNSGGMGITIVPH